MKRRAFIPLLGGAALGAALSLSCQSADGTNTPGAQDPSASVTPAAGADQAIAAGEPDSYSATLRLTSRAAGERPAAPPHLEADVARRGGDRRVSCRLPGDEQVVYLSRGRTRYVILPDRGRYAEVNSREAGFEPPGLLLPGHLVHYLQRQRGYVRVGEVEVNGRTVAKYVAAGEARAGAQAGDAGAGGVVYVDKITGLPLRAELISEAAGDARGVRVVVVVTEMSNVRTEAPQDLFALPRGMRKVEAEQVRRQVNHILHAAGLLAGPLLDQVGAAAADADAPD